MLLYGRQLIATACRLSKYPLQQRGGRGLALYDIGASSLHCQKGALLTTQRCDRRQQSSTTTSGQYSDEDRTEILRTYSQSISIPSATHSFQDLARCGSSLNNEQVVVHGYLGTQRNASKTLTFAELHDASLQRTIQLVSNNVHGQGNDDPLHDTLRDLAEHVPVTVSGTIKARKTPKEGNLTSEGETGVIADVEIKLENIVPLNSFPNHIIMTAETVFPPEQRHLQIRNERSIREALHFRSQAAHIARDELCTKQNFTEIETPLLFKSTPEGAREFLVPTRTAGLAYALPQSPQQYKQILMGSGIPRYMQITKCFRDEDLRADRQPEFTQVDLEMAFASSDDVIHVIEKLIRRLWAECLHLHDLPSTFPRLSYHESMSRYGSDKPDQRFGSEISRVDYMLPVDLISKIGPLTDPIVELMKFPISEDSKTTMAFVSSFMESPEATFFLENPDGQPGIFVVDSRKPLLGLQAFGFEAAERIEDMFDVQDGDLIVIQARKNIPHSGGSTAIGNLRLALQKTGVKKGLLQPPKGFKFTWITDFPMFSPNVADEPGQGGAAGISATHHPFTAPKSAADVELLLSDPLLARADHYDLVVNGVELGGGSRRIHDARMQEFVMRDVLKMSEARIAAFSHLFEVLRAGCPPHAGIALGFDRLVAVMLGKESVRDVIAFPKSGRGEDVLVKSPSTLTDEQLKTYHLKLI